MRKIGNMASQGVIRGSSASAEALLPSVTFEFLIANLELEFVLSHKNSIQYKFLIANIRSFLIAVLAASRTF
jgi:hypothetical protein